MAKIIPIAIICRRNKQVDTILEGLLIGAAVGACFAAFETAGYMFNAAAQSFDTMMVVMVLRGILAPGGHVAWAALEGGAPLMIRGMTEHKSDKQVISDKRFLLICLLPIVMHSVWDMPFDLPFLLKCFLLVAIIWAVVLCFVDLGLKQIAQQKDSIQQQAEIPSI